MTFVLRVYVLALAVGVWPTQAFSQAVPRAPEAPSNAIPAGLVEVSPCTGRRMLDPCGLRSLPTPRPLPPLGPGGLQGGGIRLVAAGHGPNVPFGPDAGPLFLHRVTKAQQARVDAEIAVAARRVRAARDGEP